MSETVFTNDSQSDLKDVLPLTIDEHGERVFLQDSAKPIFQRFSAHQIKAYLKVERALRERITPTISDAEPRLKPRLDDIQVQGIVRYAREGLTLAQVFLGQLCENGSLDLGNVTTREAFERAEEMYRLAANRTDANADIRGVQAGRLRLAYLLTKGCPGRAPDIEAARELMKSVKNKVNLSAMESEPKEFERADIVEANRWLAQHPERKWIFPLPTLFQEHRVQLVPLREIDFWQMGKNLLRSSKNGYSKFIMPLGFYVEGIMRDAGNYVLTQANGVQELLREHRLMEAARKNHNAERFDAAGELYFNAARRGNRLAMMEYASYLLYLNDQNIEQASKWIRAARNDNAGHSWISNQISRMLAARKVEREVSLLTAEYPEYAEVIALTRPTTHQNPLFARLRGRVRSWREELPNVASSGLMSRFKSSFALIDGVLDRGDIFSRHSQNAARTGTTAFSARSQRLRGLSPERLFHFSWSDISNIVKARVQMSTLVERATDISSKVFDASERLYQRVQTHPSQLFIPLALGVASARLNDLKGRLQSKNKTESPQESTLRVRVSVAIPTDPQRAVWLRQVKGAAAQFQSGLDRVVNKAANSPPRDREIVFQSAEALLASHAEARTAHANLNQPPPSNRVRNIAAAFSVAAVAALSGFAVGMTTAVVHNNTDAAQNTFQTQYASIQTTYIDDGLSADDSRIVVDLGGRGAGLQKATAMAQTLEMKLPTQVLMASVSPQLEAFSDIINDVRASSNITVNPQSPAPLTLPPGAKVKVADGNLIAPTYDPEASKRAHPIPPSIQLASTSSDTHYSHPVTIHRDLSRAWPPQPHYPINFKHNSGRILLASGLY